MHKVTFYPVGNGESIQIDLANGKKVLFDFANLRNADDPDDLRIDLPKAIAEDLKNALRDRFDIVAFTHLDDDHIHGATDFFYLQHAQKYQGGNRVKIDTLWVPAAAIIEKGCSGEARILQAEARHRLRNGKGIRVFSRPALLEDWLREQGLTLENRQHLISDAGTCAPELTLDADEVEFFIHSPFAHRLEDGSLLDRNIDSLVVQVCFTCNGQTTRLVLTADLPHDAMSELISMTRRHGNDERLNWDIIDIPHHCSYRSLSSDQGATTTIPVEGLRWLYETQANSHGILVSSSDPIPSNDDSTQPPHRQAARYYRECAASINGEFIVTMEHPKPTAPAPLVITIDKYKSTVKRTSLSTVGIITSQPSPRAG